MGRENHTSLFSFYTEPCACAILAGKLSSCCDNESEILKVDSDQNTVSVTVTNPVQLPLIEIFEIVLPEVVENPSITNFSNVEQRPPPLDFTIMNCSFIFYDYESELSA